MGFKARRAIAFDRSDGWVLAAAAHAGRTKLATWRSIVGSADYMNRAIPTYEELAGAAARLDAAGLVRYRPDGLLVSPAVLALVDDSTRVLTRQYARVWALPAPAPGAGTPLPHRLPRAAYDEAVRIHTDWG